MEKTNAGRKRGGRSTRLQKVEGVEESGPSKASSKQQPTIIPPKVELPPKPEPPVIALPAAVVGDECRRSARKKNLKFDVRDLLLKSRRSHKIQIEARIDSNAPPTPPSNVTTANAGSVGAVSNKNKTFFEKKSAIFRRFSISEQQNKVIPPLRPPPPLAPTSKITLLTAVAAASESDAGDTGKVQLRPLNRTQEFFKGSMLKSKQNSSLIVAQMESSTGSVAMKTLSPPTPAPPVLPAISPKVTRSRRKEIGAPTPPSAATAAPGNELEGSAAPKRSRVRGRPSKTKTTDSPVPDTSAKKRVADTAEEKAAPVTRRLVTKEAEKVLTEGTRSVKTQRRAKDTPQDASQVDEKTTTELSDASQCTLKESHKETSKSPVSMLDTFERETASEELVEEEKKPRDTLQESSDADHLSQHGSQGSCERNEPEDLLQDTAKDKHRSLQDSFEQKDSSGDTSKETVVENTSNTSLTFACVTMLEGPSRMLNSSVEIQEIDISALNESPQKKAEHATTIHETLDEILEISSSSSSDSSDTRKRKCPQPIAESTNTMFSAISWFSPSANPNEESSILVDIVEQQPEVFEFDPMPSGCRRESSVSSEVAMKEGVMSYSYGEPSGVVSLVESADVNSSSNLPSNSTAGGFTEISANSNTSFETLKARQDAVIIDVEDTVVELTDEQPAASASKEHLSTGTETESVAEFAEETYPPATEAKGDNSKGGQPHLRSDAADLVVDVAEEKCAAPNLVVESAEEKPLATAGVINAQPSRAYRTRRSKTISHAAFEEFADRNMASSSKRSTKPRWKEKTPELLEAEKPAPTDKPADVIEPTIESPLAEKKTVAVKMLVEEVKSLESPQKDTTAEQKVETDTPKEPKPVFSTSTPQKADVSDTLSSVVTLAALEIPSTEVALKEADVVEIVADASQLSDPNSELPDASKDVGDELGKRKRERSARHVVAANPRTDSPTEVRQRRSLPPAKAPDFFIKFESKRKSRQRKQLGDTAVATETQVKDKEAKEVKGQDTETQAKIVKEKAAEGQDAENQVGKEKAVEVQAAGSETQPDKAQATLVAEEKTVEVQAAEKQTQVVKDKPVKVQDANTRLQVTKEKPFEVVDVPAKLTLEIETNLPIELQTKPDTPTELSLPLELEEKSKTPEQPAEIKETVVSEEPSGLPQSSSKDLDLYSVALESTMALSNKEESVLARTSASTSDLIAHNKEALELKNSIPTAPDATKKQAELATAVIETPASLPKKLTEHRRRSSYRPPRNDRERAGQSAYQEKPLEAEEQKKRRREEQDHAHPPLAKTKKSKWDVRVRQSPEKSKQKPMEKHSNKPKSPEFSKNEPESREKTTEVPRQIREGLDKSDRTSKKSRREAKRSEEVEKRPASTDSAAKHKSERDESQTKPVKSLTETKGKSESLERADWGERRPQKSRNEAPRQRETKKAQRLVSEVKAQVEPLDNPESRNKKSRNSSSEVKPRASDQDRAETFGRKSLKSPSGGKNKSDDITDKNSQKQLNVAKNRDESPERKQQKSSKAQTTEPSKATPKKSDKIEKYETALGENKTDEPSNKTQKSHIAFKSHAQQTETHLHTSSAEKLTRTEHKFLEEEAEPLNKSAEEKAARKKRWQKMQMLLENALEINPTHSSTLASEISTTPPPKSGPTQPDPITSTPLAKDALIEKDKSNEKANQPSEQDDADPLKDIEKFIEDGEILLKRDFTIDEDTVDEFAEKTELPAEEVEDSTDAFKEEDMSSISGMTDVMFESDDVYLDGQQLNPYDTPADTPIVTPSCTPQPDSASFYVNYDDEDNTGVRRSSRLKQNSRSTKLLVGRGLVEGKSSFSLDELAVVEASNAKFLKDMGDRLSNFHVIKENIYKTERIVSKEQMSCDCFLTPEEEERGELGCGDDCLNRLLMIECGPECNVKNRCTNVRIQKHFCSPCLAFRTEKKGIGLMANGIIEPGEFIMEYVGEVIDGTEFERRRTLYSQDKNRHYYFMSLRSDAIIDATVKGNISRFINHSCDPNAETQKWTVNGELRIGFFSRKTIMAGEEITFDYQYQRYGREAQRCYCEASNCRGWIGEEPDSDESEQLDDSDEETPNLASLMLEEDEESDSPIDDVEEAKKTLEAAAARADLTPIEPLEASDPRLREGVDSIERFKHLLRQIAEKEVQKKQKKKTTRHVDKQWKTRFLGDPDIDDELDYFNRYGARSKDDLLVLSRLMVRVKSREIRKNLLSIVIKADKSIQKLFMDYHGFKLLYGWMNEDGDDLEMRKTILDVLEALPITNKNGLLESKVFETLEGWCGVATAMKKEPTSSSEESSQESTQQGDAATIDGSIEERAAKLRSAFDNLPLFDRIPKRVRIEQMKEHEREVDRQYEAALEDDSNNPLRSDRYRRDRSGRERHRSQPARRYDPDYDHYKHLSKEERREKFERKVRRDEEEKRQSEHRREFDVKCRFFYLDPATTHYNDLPFCVNPNNGQWYANDGHPIPTPPSHFNVPLPEMPTDPKEYKIDEKLIDLPPNWAYGISPLGGFIYYYHIKDRVPQWDKPTFDDETDSEIESNPDEELCERLCNMNEEEMHAYIEEEVKKSRIERTKVLIDSRPISPRREEDRLYNQIETRKYKENKEKMRKRKEEIRRRRAEQAKNGIPMGLPSGVKIKVEKDDDAPDQQDPYELPPDALPIAEYLLSSDEEDAPKVGVVQDPSVMHTLDIVEGDKIVDELDALTANKKLKRPLPLKREMPSTSTAKPVEQDKKPEKTEKHRHQSKKHKVEKRKSKDSDSKYRKRKEKFRCDIAGIIVENLKPYLLENRESGRIRNESDFKHLVRKLTHFVMVKEMKYCEAIGQTLVVTESVKNKSREFIRKYMAKYDGDYERPKNDPEFRDIPIKL